MSCSALRRELGDNDQWVEFVVLSGSLTMATARGLAAAELGEDRTVRAVVRRSEGPEFCVGSADDLDPIHLDVDPAAALARLRMPVAVELRGRCRSV